MSSTGGLWIFACLCLSIIREVEGVVTSPPLNTVAKVNGDAIFNCTATPSGPLAWSLTKDGISSGEIRITTGCSVDAGLQSHYRTEQPGGPSTCNLIVFDITMEQAGVYYCVDTAASSLALLTVLDSSPTITYNNTPDVMEGEKVVITCRLNYSGSVEPASTLRPHFYWTDHTGNNVSNAYNPPPSNNSVLSQLTVTAVREDITPYTCHVYLQLIQTIPAYATNTPSVDSIAGSPNITVLYSPSTPAITSRPEVITINDVVCGISVLTCSSTGNPTPNYKWSDSAENVVLTTTNTLTLAEVNRSYKCEAYNTIRNVMRNASATTTVSTDNCTSTAGQRCCVFPRDETTSVTVVGCDNGALCDCSNGTSGIRLICNATTFPNASHMWSGPEIEPIYSPIFDKVTQNGSYGCTAYFNQALSNYTGDVKFSNGTNEENVGQCCETWVLVISFVIPYVGGNVIVLVVGLVLYFKHSGFKSLMDNRFPGITTMTIVLLSIASVFFGLLIVPIVVTIAYCSSLNQGDVSSKPGGPYQMDGISERSGSRQENGESSAEVSNQQVGYVANAGPGIPCWSIAVMWCVDIVFLFPITFVAVFFVPCNQMRFEIS